MFAGLLVVAGCDQAFGLTIATDARAAGDAVQMTGVVAHYPMDAIGSKACLVDATGLGHDGTCIGESVKIVPGQIGSAFELTGTTRIQIPTGGVIAGPGAFTFSGWINYTSLLEMCPFNRIYGSLGADSWQFCLTDTGGIFYFEDASGGEMSTAVAVSATTWHHIALVSTGGEILTYLDGRQTDDEPYALVFDTGLIEIGADVDPSQDSSAYTGDLDDIWIFDRALSQTEVLALETP